MPGIENGDSNLVYGEYEYLARTSQRILGSVYWRISETLSRVPLLPRLVPGCSQLPLMRVAQRQIGPVLTIDQLDQMTGDSGKLKAICDDKRTLLETIIGSRQWRFYCMLKTVVFHLPVLAYVEELSVKLQRAYHADWPTLPSRIIGPQLYQFFSRLSIKSNWVMFESHRGLSYSCNPKYIYEELNRRDLDYKYIWSFESPDKIEYPGKLKVKRFSLRYYYYLARSKFLVNNAAFYPRIRYRDGQVSVNTQHGTPLKHMGREVKNVTRVVAQRQGDEGVSADYSWNLLVSPNSYSTEIFRRCFRYTGPVLESGYPRNDIFHTRNTPDEILAIKKRYGIAVDKKVLLYAPTWRDTQAKTVDMGFDLELDLEHLQSQFDREYILILRLHHLISKNIVVSQAAARFVMNCSAASYDMQELLLVTDVLITDYSSVMFDFANLNRHQIFYVYDYDNYAGQRRGIYFDLFEKGPGPVVRNQEELILALQSVDQDAVAYRDRRQEFANEFCRLETGESARMVVDKVFLEAIYDLPLRPHRPPAQRPVKQLRAESLGVRASYNPLYIHPVWYLKSKSRFVSDRGSDFTSLIDELQARQFSKAVIFGNASCLNEIDEINPGYFSDQNYLTLGLNRSLYKVASEVVMWTDFMTLDDILQTTRGQEKPTTFLHVLPPRDHRLPALFDARFKELALYWTEKGNFREWHSPGLYLFRNILVSALHLCFKLGVKDILLIGIDMETRNYFHKEGSEREVLEYEIRNDFQVERLCHGFSTQRIVGEVLEYLVRDEGFRISYNGTSGFLASIPGLNKVWLHDLPGAAAGI